MNGHDVTKDAHALRGSRRGAVRWAWENRADGLQPRSAMNVPWQQRFRSREAPWFDGELFDRQRAVEALVRQPLRAARRSDEQRPESAKLVRSETRSSADSERGFSFEKLRCGSERAVLRRGA